MAIAFQVAMALEYLHESRDPAVIHGDIKASNVLLDAGLDAKLCDFGFAHVGFSAAVRPAAATTAARASARHVMGSPGYLDPPPPPAPACPPRRATCTASGCSCWSW
ncbi:hypothetical protein ACQ4PT_055129 [Festuca glaucescens]